MVLASVYCLMIGHPGLVFKNDEKRMLPSREDVDSRNVEAAKGLEMQPMKYSVTPP